MPRITKKSRIEKLLKMGCTTAQIYEIMGGNKITIRVIIYQCRNAEKHKEYQKKRYLENREEYLKWQKEYYIKNKEYILQRGRDYWERTDYAYKRKCRLAGVDYE